jgi:4'-phosphopantetheinyl transferase superfamily
LLFLEQWGMNGRMQQEFLTLIWSAKEALFKWYGLGDLDFKRHMQMTGNIRIDGDWIKLPFVFEKDDIILLDLDARIFDEQALALACVLT